MKWFLLIVFTLSSNVVLANDFMPLSHISTEQHPDLELPLVGGVSFDIETVKAAGLAKKLSQWSHIRVDSVGENVLSVSLRALPQYTGTIEKRYLQPSFVIDIDNEDTKRFVSGFKFGQEQSVDLVQLASYVSDYIEDTTYIHGFNFASTVARQKSGDCTEYAVLTAALGRSIGLPGRVVLGTVIVENQDSVEAFGHAWTEVWQSGAWHSIDAALFNSNAVQRYYLPTGTLKNEGPGYGLSLIESISFLPQKIAALRHYIDSSEK